MAISGFGRGRDSDMETPSVTGRAPAPSTSGAGGLTAFIDQGSEFEGKLSFKDTVRIDGRFSGEISSENTLIVGESGEIHANIRSNTIAVSGVVVGDIDAASKVVIHKTGRVEGDVKAPSLVVEEGATLNGSVRMSGSKGGSLKAIDGARGGAPKDAPKKDDSPPKG